MAEPRVLQLRAREALLPTGRERGIERQSPIVEVVSHGEVLGQLPVTRATYEMKAHDLGKLTIEVFVESAEVRGHE